MYKHIAQVLRSINTQIQPNLLIYFLVKPFVHLSRFLHKYYASKIPQNTYEVIDSFMGNIRMNVNISTYMGGAIYWCGYHHLSETMYLKNWLKSDMVFMDIGANQGEFTLLAAKKLTKGKVISFEPVSAYYSLLENNIKLNNFSNVILNNYGLSDAENELPIYTSLAPVHQGSVHDGLSSLYQTEERNILQEVIRLKVLNRECKDWGLNRLDFIKIDIEGAELFALKGGRDLIAKFLPDILMEVSDTTYNAAGYKVADMLAFLGEYGYKPFRILRGIPVLVSDLTSIHEGDYLFKVANNNA